MKLFAKKPIEVLLAQANEEGEHTLKRGLGPLGLTALGIGAVIGAGIFILTGQQAAVNAGPGIAISFVLAGITCAFAALCYAELASMIPVSGSAYTYAYATLGEFVAWIIGWDLIVEYLFAAGTVASGWSGYLKNFLEGPGLNLHPPEAWMKAPFTFDGHQIVRTITEAGDPAILNLPAMFIVALAATVLISGITQSALFNNLIVMLKVGVVLIVIAFGAQFIDMENWRPFVPPAETGADGKIHFGYPGILTAAGVIFFAYIGFEAVSTAAQEARNPQKTMPIGILASLAICTVLYIAMALVLTGMAHYTTLNDPAPVTTALAAIPELAWLRQVVNVGVVVGLGSTILTLLYGQSRIFFAMSRDGLLPPFFGKVHRKTRTPVWGTVFTAVFAGLMGGLFPIGVLGELVSIGTLLAFAIICGGVIYLRLTRPDLPRGFRVPAFWLVGPLGILSCGYLIYGLPRETFMRLLIWMGIGLLVYFGYAYWHSRYHEKKLAAAE